MQEQPYRTYGYFPYRTYGYFPYRTYGYFPLRTTVIGSYPFPAGLEFASQQLDQFGVKEDTNMVGVEIVRKETGL